MNETLFLCLCVALAVGLASLLCALSFGVGAGLFFYFRKRFTQHPLASGTLSVSTTAPEFPIDPDKEFERLRQEREAMIAKSLQRNVRRRNPHEALAATMVEPMPPPPVVTSWKPGERIGEVQEDEECCDNPEDNQ